MACGFEFLQNEFQTMVDYLLQITAICISSYLNIWGLKPAGDTVLYYWVSVFFTSVKKEYLKSHLPIAKQI